MRAALHVAATLNGDSGVALVKKPNDDPAPLVLVRRPLPSVLILHTGGTLGMDPSKSFEQDVSDPYKQPELRHGTGGHYGGLRPGQQLHQLLQVVPELSQFANLDLHVAFNKDSSRVGPREWVQLAKVLHAQRDKYDAFLVVHGTDTLAYTAAALSFMLAGFRKPIVLTGWWNLPLLSTHTPFSCRVPAAAAQPTHRRAHQLARRHHVRDGLLHPAPRPAAGGVRVLWRAASARQQGAKGRQHDVPCLCLAHHAPTGDAGRGGAVEQEHPPAAGRHLPATIQAVRLLVGQFMRQHPSVRDSNVMRIPIVPGCDPRQAYGDLVGRGVRGVVLESFGVGNMPDLPQQGWLPFLRQQRKKGLCVYLASQCLTGPMHPELYKAGSVAIDMGCTAGPRMTAESAVVKMMHCLAYPDIPLGMPIAGEM